MVEKENKALTIEDLIKKEEAKLEEMKKKNKSAWAKTVKAKTFGLREMFKFTWPRIWLREWK